MIENTVTIVGNLVADPELKFTAKGAAVVKFSIASTPRVFDRATNGWVDGTPLFLNCELWRDAAENVAESLSRGSRVIATGKLKQDNYETRTGEKRTVLVLAVEEIGPSLRYAVATPEKAGRRGGTTTRPAAGQEVAAGQGEPWGVPAGSDAEAPF